MNVKVLRLHELTKAQIKKVAAFLKHAIHTEKSGWVCQQALRPGSWGDAYLARLQECAVSPLPALNTDRWIGLVDGRPVGVCCFSRGRPDRTITLFLIDPGFSPTEQLEIADTIALRSINDVLADEWGKRNFVSYFPDNSPAAVYAKLCKVRVVETGPIACKWEIGIEEVHDNILARRK